ncbi:MAG: hypothetical protein AAGC69_21625 [Paracraurococcus sp.]|jgi:hypothetical protein
MPTLRVSFLVLLVAPLLAPLAAARAETCSTSTLASPIYAFARWCGDPPAEGRLRLGRRDGRQTEYEAVPLDVFREVVRVRHVDRYVATAIQPHFTARPHAAAHGRDAPMPPG